ncbi:MAG: oligoendopeptidase F [Deltaproteobacteria bacterium]|nr:oligoendopeptidase F [Deltaproteobacteria bacterium]
MKPGSKTVLSIIAAGLVVCGTGAAFGEKEVVMRKHAPAVEMGKDGKLPDRASVEAKFKWDLTHLYRDEEAWEADRKALEGITRGLSAHKGKVKNGAAGAVKECLDAAYKGKRTLARLSAYAMMKYHGDTRVSAAQGEKSIIDKMAAEFSEGVAFIEPELLTLKPEKIEALSKHTALKDYSQYLKNVIRKKPHVLGKGEEEILAASTIMGAAPYNIYTSFTGSDMDFGEITDSAGNKVKLSIAAYIKYRESPDRGDRQKVFEAFFGSHKKVSNTMATALSAQIDANIFYARSRKHSSALASALFSDNIPVTLYENLVKNIESNLAALHRYLGMRKRLLGLPELRYFDLYVPVIKKVEIKSDYETGTRAILESLKPMGAEYLDVLAGALKPGSGWIDVYPNEGKKSGAYMTGEHYDVHPYVLLNFVGNYSSVSTAAHEMGHAIHSHLSNKTQPYPKADYPIFVAEVASTFHEALLMEHMLKTAADPEQKLYLLVESMEMFRTTMFRQAMFAEFEWQIYKMAEKKEPLTADSISAKYLSVVKKYYGHDKGVVQIDDLYGIEWAYIPHFYYNFYVYQYVTGFIAANALAQDVLTKGDKARDQYVSNMLRGGSSDYALNLVKAAGVDMLAGDPYEKAIRLFEKRMDEAEKLMEARKR